MSSSVVRIWQSAPLSFIASRILASLDFLSSPAYARSSSHTGSFERAGRSSQMLSARSSP